MGIWPRLEAKYPNIAYLYAFVGSSCLAFMQIFFKFASDVASPLQLLFIRGFVLFSVSCVILRTTARSPYLSPPGTSSHMQCFGWS
jgi:hypothetical protein